MFDRYIVVDSSLRNVEADGEATGFSFDIRIPYYRGLGLSMVEVDVIVDGQAIPADHVTFAVHGNSYRSDQMGEVFDDRWGFGEAATLVVARPGGLAPGEHDVGVVVRLRVSYLPTESRTTDAKLLTV